MKLLSDDFILKKPVVMSICFPAFNKPLINPLSLRAVGEAISGVVLKKEPRRSPMRGINQVPSQWGFSFQVGDCFPLRGRFPVIVLTDSSQ